MLYICVICFATIVLFLRIKTGAKRVYIVVLGDIGRSPRMQYHAMSLAKTGFEVFMFGYGGSKPHSELTSNEAVHLVYMQQFPLLFQKFVPRIGVFFLKVVWQTLNLLFHLLVHWKPSHILMQNPPSLPAMVICWFVSFLRGCSFIIDWHNYGYTIMALSFDINHPMVNIYKWYEKFFGRWSSNNICVSKNMKEDLNINWNIQSVTMYDKPPSIFRSLDIEEKHSLFYKLPIFRDENKESGDELTTFTIRDLSGQVRYKRERPALIVSSTSWTADEDFSILFKSLNAYNSLACDSDNNLPSMVCVITGKGPLKEYYMSMVDRSWSKVSVYTPWLEAEDYPRLLASADLGICLHMSSSGLDLPMKVVDMFGCGLPVCAMKFQSIHELVANGENGMICSNEFDLTKQLQDLLTGFPDRCNSLKMFRNNLKSFQEVRWDETWTDNVLPMFL